MDTPTKYIIDNWKQVPSNASWGSYDESTGEWSDSIYSGEAIRQWIQKKMSVYGPYDSLDDERINDIPEEWRYSTTIGIKTDNGIKEYLWKNADDITVGGLTEKIEDINLSINRIGNKTIDVSEGNPIVLRLEISGRATINKGAIYQVVGDYEVFVGDITSLSKGENSITIASPLLSGTYTYRIKIIDTAGYLAKNLSNEDYEEYIVRYGGISASYNLSNFDKILIKNIQSIANQYFTGTISVRDDSYSVTGIYLSDKITDVELLPHENLNEQSDSYIGYNYYIIPNESALTALDGKFCYIKLTYEQDGEDKVLYKDLFTLLKSDSLEISSQTVEKNYYYQYADYYTFLLHTGIARVAVYITQDENSDFTFLSTTVNSYSNFSLRIVPNNVKLNAVLKMRCSFNINNVEKVYHFEIPLGNIVEIPQKQYYTPTQGGSITLDKLVDANENDILEDIIYYKVIPELVSDNYITCSFIADIYCRINLTNNKTKQYIKIWKGTELIGYVSEDIINLTKGTGCITDTPLNEWVQIGFGYNIEESITRGNVPYESRYYAIYINGLIAKTVQIDNKDIPALVYDGQSPVRIELCDDINVSKCYVYYKNNSQQYMGPNAETSTIIYNNFLAHNPNYSEPADLPVLKLMRITNSVDRARYFLLLKEQNEDIKHLTLFGLIGLLKAYEMSNYVGTSNDNLMDDDYATLFRQSVDIKKPAQKEYGVLCTGRWMVNGENILEGCIIEVHTQGTSTLQYSVPNFKFTFWKVKNEGGEDILYRYCPPFVLKGENDYYQESIYTAKADYMDSSHLNNTPTCIFYNELILSLIPNELFPTFVGSPSAAQGGLDAIVGFPIILEISDVATSMDDQNSFINIGSFMLNVDKTGDSLGFETQQGSCLSLEGTSNDNTSGASGRFTVPDGVVLKSYMNNGEMDESEIEQDGTEIINAIKASGKKLNIRSELNGVVVENHPYVKWCRFLSEGLEYRYPDGDIYKTSESGTTTYLTKVMPVADFKKVYKMWQWVSTSDNNPNYKNEFEDHFDLNYCMLYFVQVMIFGQTDNLGKNAMFDCWDGDHWYPRPYDLDSQAGLDNNGNDNIAPFVEIKNQFSLNYDHNRAEDYEWLADNYLLDADVPDPENPLGEPLYRKSVIQYAGQNLDRYHYSSNNSKLWINFYKNYKGEIESFYNNLRTNGGYTPEAIIELCQDALIDRLGTAQYNRDFTNKYLATSYQGLAYGNRWYKFKKWIRQRFAFCDSYFGASDTANYNTISAFTYDIEVESPQYITQTYQSDSITKFVIDRTTFSAGSGAATKITLKVNQDQVLSTSLFRYVSYGDGPLNYRKLTVINTAGNNSIPGITGLVGSDLSNVKELDISNSSVGVLENLPYQLKKLTANNVLLNTLSFLNGCLIEEISLRNSVITQNVTFGNLPNLKKLDISGCTFRGSITLWGLGLLELLIMDGATFIGDFIIQNDVNVNEFNFSGLSLHGIQFDGSSIDVKKLNFINTVFDLSSVNMNAISGNVEEIYFNGCKNLTHIELANDKTFSSLNTFSLYDSSIVSLGSNTDSFDASKFQNIGQMYKVSVNSDTGAISKVQFNFYNTKIVNITNLNWVGTGSNLFRDCRVLQSIQGLMTLKTSINYMFYRCNALSTLPTINIDYVSEDRVMSATYVFCEANNIGYSTIESIISKCRSVTDFSRCCWGVNFPDNTTIRLNTLFANNGVAETLYGMFGAGGFSSGITLYTNNLKVSGRIPSSVTSTDGMFMQINSVLIPYDILLNASSLSITRGMFYNSNVTFFIPSGVTSVTLPSYTIYEENQGQQQEVIVILTNAVDKSFFYVDPQTGLNSTITNVLGMFLSSNVQTIDSDLFSKLTMLEDCSACFYSGRRSFDRELVVDNMWLNNPRLTKVSGCFMNVLNATCSNTLNFHSSVSSVNISNLFGLSGTGSAGSVININISSIVPNITTDYSQATYGNNTSYYGTFANRKVHILDSNSTILSKLSGLCRQLFYYSTLYISSDVSTIDLSNVTNCYGMFRGCTAYKYNQSETYDDNNRFFADFLLPTSCANCEQMFRGSSILASLPALRSAGTQNTRYMFALAIINSNVVEIPANYFLVCKNSITTADYMFYNNIYITGLEYSVYCGLFSDCTRLSNISSMFESAYYLHGGIPKNLFGSTALPLIKTLYRLFSRTYILYDVEDFSEKYINASTIAPLTNLQNINEMFLECRPGNTGPGYGTYNATIQTMDGGTAYIIDPGTFSTIKLLNIRSVFKRTSGLNIPFRFLGFVYGEEAFYDSSISEIGSPFVNDLYLSEVRNVSRMFYALSTSTPKEVTNLATFINSLKENSSAVMNNIAGNLSNNDIDAELKESTTGETIYHGISTTSKTIYA